MWKRIKNFWNKKTTDAFPYPHNNNIRTIVDTSSIRNRITNLGWKIKELPIRKKNPDSSKQVIVHYKLIALKNDKSFEATGTSLDEAMVTLGTQLGVIPRK